MSTKYYFTLLIFIVCVSSCKKEIQIPATTADQFTIADLSDQGWMITSKIVKANTHNPHAVANDLITVEEVWNDGEACHYDDVYQFKIDGEYNRLNGLDECGQGFTAKWEISTSGTIRIYGNGFNFHHNYFRHGDNFFEIFVRSTSIHGGSPSVSITRYEHL